MKLRKRKKEALTLEKFMIYYCNCNCGSQDYVDTYTDQAMEYNKKNDPPMPL